MLSSMTLILALLAGGEEQTQPLPQMPDWRSEFMKNPPLSALTTEWRCGTSSEISKASLLIEDVGQKIQNQIFRVSLTELIVEGEEARAETQKKVTDTVADLNNVTTFQGQCRDTSPGLFISGFILKDGRYQKEEFHFDLTE